MQCKAICSDKERNERTKVQKHSRKYYYRKGGKELRLTFCCCVLLSWRYGDWKSATGKVKPRNLIIITILILIKWSFDLQMWSHSECLFHKHFVVQKSEVNLCFDLISLINDDNYAIVIHEIWCWMVWCPNGIILNTF